MLINLKTIAQGHTQLTQSVTLQQQGDYPRLAYPIECIAEVDRLGDDLHLQVSFSGKIVLQCSRCLNDYDAETAGNFRLLLYPQAKKAEMDYAQDDESIQFYNIDELFSIEQTLLDEILTEVTLKPLCREKCPGIEIAALPGISIEAEQTEPDTDIDPRWEALKKLKERSVKP
jgi:uncharacterized metal-binding protein YceD (DUF177 family)